MIELYLDYFLINPIARIDYEKLTISIGNNIHYIMICIKKIQLMNNSILEQELIKIDNIYKLANYESMLEYIEKVKNILAQYLPKTLKYKTDYYIAPLMITSNKFVLGIFFIMNKLALENTIKFKVIETWNFLSSIHSINITKKYDILGGILNYNSSITYSSIPIPLVYYFRNAHNYLPKYNILRMEKKITAISSWKARGISQNHPNP